MTSAALSSPASTVDGLACVRRAASSALRQS
jgi:hypothetical protein